MATILFLVRIWIHEGYVIFVVNLGYDQHNGMEIQYDLIVKTSPL